MIYAQAIPTIFSYLYEVLFYLLTKEHMVSYPLMKISSLLRGFQHLHKYLKVV